MDSPELNREELSELCSNMKQHLTDFEEYIREGEMSYRAVQKRAGQMINVVNQLKGKIKQVRVYAQTMKEQKRERLAEFTIEQVRQFLSDPIYPRNKKSKHRKPCFRWKTNLVSLRRVEIHFQIGLKCACCPRVGTKYILERDAGGGFHLDLFSEDDCMMTIDHIYPRPKGGPNEIVNYQMMCRVCNINKADSLKEES